MIRSFDQSWTDWIALNIKRGCDRAEMAQTLLDNGFAPKLIERALGVPLKRIVRATEGADGNADGKAVLSGGPAMARAEEEPASATVHGVHLPSATAPDTEGKLDLRLLENFLDDEECLRLIQIIRQNLRASTTTNDRGDFASFRTSKSCDLALLNDPFVNDVQRRICAAIGIDISYAEGMQAQWYDAGEEFRAHTDFFAPGTAEYERFGAEKGQRTWTFMIYLNRSRAGGATRFTKVNHAFHPEPGRALVWNNLYKDGRPNPDSEHWGLPVEAGFKVIITQWFRERGQGAMFRKTSSEYLAALTKRGFLKARAPELLQRKLLSHYRTHQKQARTEQPGAFVAGRNDAQHPPSEVIELPETLRRDATLSLQPMIEAWIGDFAVPVSVSDVHRYLDGTRVKLHRDQDERHRASVLMNISQKLKRPWRLLIEDHAYRRHEITIAPGEVLLYEGAKLLHGRPEPCRGDHFADLIAHYDVAGPTRS